MIDVDDSLEADKGNRYDQVLANSLFCKKSNITIINEEGKDVRERSSENVTAFCATTSNK